MYYIGISAFYHDSAVALIQDDQIIECIQEERLSRVKNDSNFPINAFSYLISEYCLTNENVSSIVFYDKPFLKFERITESIVRYSPRTYKFALKALTSWLGSKLNTKSLIRKHLKKLPGNLKEVPIKFSEHHFSHAAASYYTSNFSDACAVTIDGVGEWSTCSIIEFHQTGYKILKEIRFPHSIGILYSAFTFFCGFKVNSGEYKLMGLAPYGNPESEQTIEFEKKIKNKLVKIYDDGSIFLNLDYFNFQNGSETINKKKFEELFSIPCRKSESEIDQEYCNFALAAQRVTEEIYLKIMKYAKKITKSKNLCLSGGVALNCVANSKLLTEQVFENIFIHPNPGDAGAALGCVLGYYYSNKTYQPSDSFTPYLGPIYTDKEVRKALRKYQISFQYLSANQLNETVSDLLFQNKVIGWFQDRLEWGPRALGNRSILASPLNQNMQQTLNLKIKFREGFRPFAPIVKEDKAMEYFKQCNSSPYMQYTFQVKDSNYPQDFNEKFSERLKQINSKIPAITHLDHSARVQTVNKNQNPKIYDLIDAFERKSGFPVLINTSFNVRGEPIVCSPEDAINCFLKTNMDYLVLGNYLVSKTE